MSLFSDNVLNTFVKFINIISSMLTRIPLKNKIKNFIIFCSKFAQATVVIFTRSFFSFWFNRKYLLNISFYNQRKDFA